jgi:hypothetical protein
MHSFPLVFPPSAQKRREQNIPNVLFPGWLQAGWGEDGLFQYLLVQNQLPVPGYEEPVELSLVPNPHFPPVGEQVRRIEDGYSLPGPTCRRVARPVNRMFALIASVLHRSILRWFRMAAALAWPRATTAWS